MNKIYLVGISDCETNTTVGLFDSKEKAEKKLFEKRDELIASYRRLEEHEIQVASQFDWQLPVNMFTKMIENLSSNDYENWDNYPHEVPYIQEMEVL